MQNGDWLLYSRYCFSNWPNPDKIFVVNTIYQHGTLMQTGIIPEKSFIKVLNLGWLWNRVRLAMNKNQKYFSLPDHQLAETLIFVFGFLGRTKTEYFEILQLWAKFHTAIVSCSRCIWITNSSDYSRVWTANLLNAKNLPNPLGHKSKSNPPMVTFIEINFEHVHHCKKRIKANL